METTFISIHDLSPEARILYSSDSVIDVFGYTPDEIVNRSAWDFFPVGEVTLAQRAQQQRVNTDKAAVLAYCRIADKNGKYIGCEVCFTIVYDVMVVCTSIYRQGPASERRALDAPIVRRIFSSSPKDPRYHMLSHLSPKFSMPQKPVEHEPRAALFLNRFTRTLTIMYATNAIKEIIGMPAEELRGRSFYFCIAENCLPDAIKCLENAKANDSVAYLRFWFRDPRQGDSLSADGNSDVDGDVDMEGQSEDADGGVSLSSAPASTDGSDSSRSETVRSSGSMEVDGHLQNGIASRTSSGDSTREVDSHEAIFGNMRGAESSTSSLTHSPEQTPPRQAVEPVELEAVISCASDGLVVCLRKALPMPPLLDSAALPQQQRQGIFAAPWATEPMLPSRDCIASTVPIMNANAAIEAVPTKATISRPPRSSNGPNEDQFMTAIREQAVFAWALAGINGSLASFGKGMPVGEATPKLGLPIWSNDPRLTRKEADGNQERMKTKLGLFGDPGLGRPRPEGRSNFNQNHPTSSPPLRSTPP